MNDLRKDQITKMAQALIDNAIVSMDGDFTPYCFCEFCNAELHGWRYSAKDIKHDIDCPVLIAKEVLRDV